MDIRVAHKQLGLVVDSKRCVFVSSFLQVILSGLVFLARVGFGCWMLVLRNVFFGGDAGGLEVVELLF